MTRPRRFLTLSALLAISACGGPAAATQPAQSPSPGDTGSISTAAGSTASTGSATSATTAANAPHLMIVMMENREYSDVIGNASAPRINGIAADSGLATQAYGIRHPSQPNYIALITGSTQGIVDDSPHVVDVPSLPLQLRDAGVGWRAYMGGMPTACDTEAQNGQYALKHNPFMSIRAVRDDPSLCGSVVPGSRLAGDLAAGTAPPFVFVSPGLCDDGHDCHTDVADTALGKLVDMVTASSWYAQGGVIVVAWDEGTTDAGCCGTSVGGHMPLVVLSSALPRGTRLDTPLDQEGMLRGIEEFYRLPLLEHAADSVHGDLLPLLRPGS